MFEGAALEVEAFGVGVLGERRGRCLGGGVFEDPLDGFEEVLGV